jgi:hypothetical protein
MHTVAHTRTPRGARAGTWPRTRGPVVVAAALAVLLLGGCISIERDTRYRSLAATDGEELFNQIVPGQTTRAWVIARFGRPDALWLDAEEHEVLRYDNVREHRTEVSVFPLLDIDIANEDVERYFFEFEDDRLVRYWRATGEAVETLPPPAPATTQGGAPAAAYRPGGTAGR